MSLSRYCVTIDPKTGIARGSCQPDVVKLFDSVVYVDSGGRSSRLLSAARNNNFNSKFPSYFFSKNQCPVLRRP